MHQKIFSYFSTPTPPILPFSSPFLPFSHLFLIENPLLPSPLPLSDLKVLCKKKGLDWCVHITQQFAAPRQGVQVFLLFHHDRVSKFAFSYITRQGVQVFILLTPDSVFKFLFSFTTTGCPSFYFVGPRQGVQVFL